MAAGDFSSSELANIQLKADQMFADSKESQQWVPQVEALRAIIENQNARIQYVNDTAKDYDVAINWIDPCGIVAEDCENNCTLDEIELETKAKPYVITPCKKTGFSLNETDLRTSVFGFEETVARGIMASLKVLGEHWAQYSLAKLKTLVTAPATGSGAASGLANYAAGTITVPAAQYNASLAAKLMMFATLNRMNDAYMISNGELFLDYQNALFNAGNGEGKGLAAMYGSLAPRFDLFNFVKAALTEDAFIINRSAVAFASKNYNPLAVTEYRGKVNQTRYQVSVPGVAGLNADVYYEFTCVDPRYFKHVWRFETHADLFDNPAGCDGFNGIVSLTKAAS